MNDFPKHAALPGRLVIVGFGSIGQGVLPLILRHINVAPDRISVVTAEEAGRAEAEAHGVAFRVKTLTPDNYRAVLEPLLHAGDFLLNLSVDVASLALIDLARDKGCLYLDTCIEPWIGGYADRSLSPSLRSNYALRQAVLDRRADRPGGPTALVTHGANPGLVSYFLKQALLNVAGDAGLDAPPPTDRAGWASLARRVGVKAVHIAERDTQVADVPKKVGEFVNTWSIDGFVGEGCQPAELGWGSHERHWPEDGRRHEFGNGCAIFLDRPGAATRVRTWTPMEGPFHGFLVTHSESISIADYFTETAGGEVVYRPTVHYAYHPCDDAVLSLHELAGKNWQMQDSKRLLMDEIVSGVDELGVLLMGPARGAYWYGSQLSIDEARALVPVNNATSLQVTAAVLAGMVWAIENPEAGIVEPDEIDFQRILEVAEPYLGPVVGAYTDWTPLEKRGALFDEQVDRDDPWQFLNIRVV